MAVKRNLEDLCVRSKVKMGSTTAVLAIGFVLPRRAHEFRAPNLEHYSCQSRIPAAVQHYKRVCAEQQAGVGGSC